MWAPSDEGTGPAPPYSGPDVAPIFPNDARQPESLDGDEKAMLDSTQTPCFTAATE